MKKSTIVSVLIVAALCLSFAGSAQAMSYQDVVMADNPLVYYRFEDASSANGEQVWDSAENAWKHGTYVNKDWDPITFAAGIPGAGGQAVQLNGNGSDGAGNCVSAWSGGELVTENMTLSLWMKSTGDSQNNYARLIQHNGGESSNAYGIGSYPQGAGGEITVIGGGSTWYTGTGDVFDGEWHHIVVTYQQNGADLYEHVYIDGVSKWGNTKADTSLSTTYDWLTLGSEGNQWYMYNGFVGLLDEVAIYDSVLEIESIQAQYAAGIIPEPATLALLGLGAITLLRRRK